MRLTVAALVMLALLAAAPAAAQDVWRWVDENGTVHFSDKPREGAERVRVRAVQGYESGVTATPQARDATAPLEEGDDPVNPYRSVRIVAPEHDGAVWATGGGLTVLVEVQPALRSGDRIQLQLNGEVVLGTPVASTSIQITGLIRGPHTLQASIIAADGQVLLFSEDVNFNVLQASIHAPQRR